MNKSVKRLFVTLVMMCFVFNPVWSQDSTRIEFINDSDIPSDELQEASMRVMDKVNDFVRSLGKLTCSDCGYSRETKKVICADALSLFMGEGNPYPVKLTDKDGNQRELTAPAVIMEFIQSKWNQRKFSKKTKDYLTSLSRNPVAGKQHVKIGMAKAARIDNVNKTDDGLYVATVTIKLRTIRLNEGETQVLYSDDTEKTVEVYMQRVETPTATGTTRVQWIIKLGDIHAVSVE